MNTDQDGILTYEERMEIMENNLDNPDSVKAYIVCQAQHEADVEAVKAVKNPILDGEYGSGWDEQDAWDDCKKAILMALKVGPIVEDDAVEAE